jgi:hypothetical protein
MKLGRCLALILPWLARAAWGQDPPPPQLPPITSRDFQIDLFEQPALGSPRLIAMSGAINSVAAGAAGLYTNPASAAVRPETRADKFAWNVYFSTYAPVSGQDFNNNGQPITSVRRSLLGAAGLLLQYDKWGLSLDLGYTAHEIAPEAGGGLGIRSFIPHVVLARSLLDDELAVGLGLRGGALNVYTLQEDRTLFTRIGGSAELGAVWKPRARDLRLAVSGGLPVYTGAVAVRSGCDPASCQGYILPRGAVVPWDAIVGGAWRLSATRWNDPVSTDYRDERSLTVAFDLSVMGSVSDGYGMEALAARQLQPSGRHITLTPRLGLEGEVLPGWLRLRAGSYHEGARFEGIPGRWHGTAGGEARLFSFRLFGHERRPALSFAGDVAPRYHNVGLSIGLWN